MVILVHFFEVMLQHATAKTHVIHWQNRRPSALSVHGGAVRGSSDIK